MDLHNWIIRGVNSQFVIPRRSIIIHSGKTAAFSQKVTKVYGEHVQLFSPTGGKVSDFLVQKNQDIDTLSDISVGEDSLFSEYAQNDFEIEEDDRNTNHQSLFKNQYTFIFIMVVVFIIFLLWYLFSDKKNTPVIEGYEIIEE